MNNIHPKGQKKTPEAILVSQGVVPYLHSLGYRYLNSGLHVFENNSLNGVDLVVYLDQEKLKPYIIVEIKQKLSDEITLLDPAVQQALGYAFALGASVRYLLITDGSRYYWFECGPGEQTLVRLKEAPKAVQEMEQQSLLTRILTPVTDPDQFTELMQSAMQALVREGVGFGLRMGIEINRILIAKLRDEQILKSGGSSVFQSKNKSVDQVADDIKQLYQDALIALEGQVPTEGLWFLSPSALFNVVRILEPYALSTVTSSIRSHLFWKLFSDFYKIEGGVHTTPIALAELLVQLVRPHPGERILDPACGTGLFLIQAYRYIEAQRITEQAQGIQVGEAEHPLQQDIVGVEWNAEVAELAITNFVLNGISPKQIVKANVLDLQELKFLGIQAESFDVILLDPPIGVTTKDEHYLRQYTITGSTKRVTVELLFIEQSIKLLCNGGLLAVLLPDALLSSSTYSRTRNWILQHTRPRAIISLPPDAFAPVGHAGKASLLLLSKEEVTSENANVYIADIQAIEHDRSGHSTAQSDLAFLIRSIHAFFETGQVEVNKQAGSKLHTWPIPLSDLREKNWTVAQLRPPNYNLAQNIHRAYRIVQLGELVEICSGQSFQRYIERGHDTAMVFRAGAIQNLTLDLSDIRYISFQEYNRAKRAQVKIGDILVTTTGQYLGRACAIEELPIPAVASNNITILRLLPGIDINLFFLAAIISSDLGKQQIAQKQIMSAGRSFIRRDDLGTISIPLPNRETQEAIAKHLREMISTIQKLTQLVQQIEVAAQKLVMTELFAGDNDA